jgi:hypothetical protein
MEFLKDTMKLEVMYGNIDYVARLGRRKGVRPILVKCIFAVKLVVLRNSKNSVGSRIR